MGLGLCPGGWSEPGWWGRSPCLAAWRDGIGIGSGGRERRELRDWPETQEPGKRRWIRLTLRHFYTPNSQATRMLVWGETSKHLGEPGSMRK